MRFGSISGFAQPASGRGNAAGARDRCFLQDDPVLGQEVWSGLCSSSAQEAAELKRHLAPGRSRYHHRRQETLALACRRSGWLRARRNRSEPPQYKGCQTLACSSAEKAGRSAKADDHRQVAILRRRKTPDHANPRAPFPQRVEQSSRKLASAAAKTGADFANISICWKPSTVPLSFLRGPQSLCAASVKAHRPCNPPPPHKRICTLELRHRRCHLKSGIQQALYSPT